MTCVCVRERGEREGYIYLERVCVCVRDSNMLGSVWRESWWERDGQRERERERVRERERAYV